MKWNCDAVDEATNETTKSSVFFCSVKDNLRCCTQPQPCCFGVLYLICFDAENFFITNTDGLFCSNISKYRQTEQQHNVHTWWGQLLISVVVPPTMRPSSIGFPDFTGTPEILTNISITNTTFYVSSICIYRSE